MNKRTGLLLIILTSISLLGIVISQVYWVKNAYELKKDQFEKRIQMGLKAVSNTIFDMENNDGGVSVFNIYSVSHTANKSFDNLNYKVLDSLLSNELICVRIVEDYEYGVYKFGTNRIIGGHYKYYEEGILNSEFKVSLSCIRNGAPYTLGLYFPYSDNIILRNMLGGFLLSGLFVLVVGFSFIYTVILNYRQKKLGRMKNDFVNNMTHEFKTPISTVSIASEMLLRHDIQDNKERIQKYAQIIYDENLRLKNQVEEVLRLALLDKGEYKIKMKELDVHRLLDETIHNSELFIHQRNGNIKKVYSAINSKIFADKMHLTNIISSLIDNANKYSPNPPEITIRTKNIKKGILISIEDKGIGIKAEDQAYIFKQFHRVHTGNIHDVKGFGMGLFYAEKMVKEHGGFIRLNSTFGLGSTFEIYLPYNELRNN